MKSLVMLIALNLLGLTLARKEEEDEPSPFYSYHENVGIPLAKEIYKTEIEMKVATDLEDRVSGGTPSALGDCPYLGGLIVTLTDLNVSVCGSSLVRNTWSVTAAHCWNDGRKQGVEVTIVHGAVTLYFGGRRTRTRDVQVHESWRPGRSVDNDIALMQHNSIQLSDNIKLVNLPTAAMSDMDVTGMTARICGYGRKSHLDKGPLPWHQVQSKADVHFINNTECQKAQNGKYVKNTTICTEGVAGGGIGTCPGDSGSGIVMSLNGTKYLMGVMSFGHSINCSAVAPRSHSRVTSYLTWLENKMTDPPIDPR